jgi:hypothetical protein
VEKIVQVAKKNLRLVVEGENRQGQVLLRGGRVRRTEADVLSLTRRLCRRCSTFGRATR